MKSTIVKLISFVLILVAIGCKKEVKTPQPSIVQNDYIEFKLDGTLYSFEFPTESILGSYTTHTSGKKYTLLHFSDNPLNELNAFIGTSETNLGSYAVEDPDNGETVTSILITLINGGNNPMVLESQTGTITFTELSQYENTVSGGGYVDAKGEFFGTFLDDNDNVHTITEGRFRSKESRP